MKVFAIFFFLGLALGQLAAISLGPVTIYSQDIFLIPLLFVFLLKNKKRRKLPLALPILAFVGTSLVSLLVNAHRFTSIEVGISALYLLRWALYASLYWIVMETNFPWLFALYLMGSAISVLGLIQYFYYPYLRNLSYLGWDPHLNRVFSTLLDPNFTGLILLLTLFLGTYLWVKKKNTWLVVSQTMTAAAFFLTYSRSSYLAIAVGIFIWVLFTKQWKYALVILTAAVLIIMMLPKGEGEGVNLFRTVSTFARVGNWKRGLELIRESPIFGHGFNTLRYVQREKGWVDDSTMISKAGAGLDNSFEFVWATAGIVGFAAYLWLLWSIMKKGSLLTKISISAIIVHSMFQNSLFYPLVLVWVWILTGGR